MDVARAFRELVTQHSAHGPGQSILTNVTFFVGAGFSKTWDTRSPTGSELFTFSKEFLQRMAENIEFDELLTQPGYPALDDAAPATFKELVYNLSMQLKYPGIRTRYMDERSIRFVLSEIKALVQERFESLCPINYLDDGASQFVLPGTPTDSQRTILQFFDWLSTQQDGSRGFARGVHTDFLSTNYDYILETILDNIGERQALRNTYRGITPTTVCGRRNRNIIQDHWALTTLIKINGGFEILPSEDGYEVDYRRRTFDQRSTVAPELMMPSKEQNYTSPYFSAIFPKAVRLLQESRILVIVGYSLSEEDALLRFLIRQFAEDMRDVHGKYIFYIDPMEQDTLRTRLHGCFRYLNRMDSKNIFTYSGGFVEWVTEVLNAQ